MKFLLAFLFTTQAIATPVWTVENLTGKAISFHGANCFNSALAVKGYDDELAFASTAQTKFYLEQFCTRHAGPVQPGDVIAAYKQETSQTWLEHTAVALEGGKIFEKESPTGLDADDGYSPYYQVKNYSDSRYLKDLSARNVRYYKCQDYQTVRAQVKACEARGEKLGIKIIRQDFQKMMLTSSKEFSLSAEALSAMAVLTKALLETPANDPCLLYFDVMSQSIFVGVKVFRIASFSKLPTFKQWKEAQDLLESASGKMEAVLRAGGSPLVIEILDP